jgi:hypothetical protein
MTKKEKVEDINVMEGIDFEKNQRRTRRIQERLKKEKRKQTIFYTIIIMLIVLILLIISGRMKTKAIKSCMELGQSREWCEVHVQ